jgi:hypothetical protein
MGEGVRLNRCRAIPGEQMMTPGEDSSGISQKPQTKPPQMSALDKFSSLERTSRRRG